MKPRPPVPGEEGRTLAEILAAASKAMDARDADERRAADPLAYVTAGRPRNLLTRMLFGRAR